MHISEQFAGLLSDAVRAAGGDKPLVQFTGQPELFFEQAFGVKLWAKQRELLYKLWGPANSGITDIDFEGIENVPDEGYSEVWASAAHGVGKTFTAALAGEYQFSVLGRPFLSTAPTGHQVRALLWQQGIATNRLNSRIRLPGRLLETPNIKVAGRPDWFATGFSTDTPEGAQGRHIDYLLIIVDECAGVPAVIFNAMKGYFTNIGVKMLCIGNPNTDRTSPFYTAFHERRGEVGLVQMSAVECPHVTAEWIAARAKEWGKKSVEYITKVLGLWPSDQDEKVLPMDWILAARDFWDVAKDSGKWDRAALDVAREGADKNALTRLSGQRLYVVRYWKQPRTNITAAEVFQDLREQKEKPDALVVDANAVGGGVVDNLMTLWEQEPESVEDCQLIPLDWSGAADDPKQYDRKIDELYFRLRARFNPEADPETRWALPPDHVLQEMGIQLTFDQLAAQLNARRYETTDKSRYKVESKKYLRKRKAGSPDAADSIAALCEEPPNNDMELF